ncbi:MAG: RNA polymerase sigma factor [Gemmatimonadaceae bacterium]
MNPFGRTATPGEPRAFEELLSEHLDALYRTAVRLCAGRVADAEDLLQDAMLRAFRSYRTLRDPIAARAWLFTILTRTNLNRVRTTHRRAERTATDFEDGEFEEALASWFPVQGPDALADATLVREKLEAALDALDAHLRPVLWLSDVEGFRQREVAEMLGIPEGTVASRLYRARRTLRAALAADTRVMSAWRDG